MEEAEAEVWMDPPPIVPPKHPFPHQRRKELGLSDMLEPPLLPHELEKALEVPPYFRKYDPHKCVFNEHDTLGLPVAGYDQCRAVLPDPTKIRYCLKHALELKYPMTPEFIEELSKAEAKVGLQSLMPTAVETLAEVMGDRDAPAGARAKAATDVLDRTGLHAKADLDVKVGATVIDMTAIIRERLAAKREQLRAAGITGSRMEGVPVVEGEILLEPEPNGNGRATE